MIVALANIKGQNKQNTQNGGIHQSQSGVMKAIVGMTIASLSGYQPSKGFTSGIHGQLQQSIPPHAPLEFQSNFEYEHQQHVSSSLNGISSRTLPFVMFKRRIGLYANKEGGRASGRYLEPRSRERVLTTLGRYHFPCFLTRFMLFLAPVTRLAFPYMSCLAFYI